jgi:hypothetical protein
VKVGIVYLGCEYNNETKDVNIKRNKIFIFLLHKKIYNLLKTVYKNIEIYERKRLKYFGESNFNHGIEILLGRLLLTWIFY